MSASPFAYDGCFSCRGTGKTSGFGLQHGSECICVAHCAHCDEPIPRADYDEGEPRRYDGMPACDACRTKCDSNDCDGRAVETLADGHQFCAACLPLAKRCRDEETPEGFRTWVQSSPEGRERIFG